jgi:hypothetical protein
VLLSDGFVAEGVVRLSGARIHGRLVADGGSFADHTCALDCLNAQVDGDVSLAEGFHAEGQVRLAQARVGGRLRCSGGHIEHEGAVAFDGENLIVKGAALFDGSYQQTGELVLIRASIAGQLELTSAQLRNASGRVIWADGLQVGGDLLFNSGFKAKGEVRLRACRVGGSLDCTRGSFRLVGAVSAENRNLTVNPDRVAALTLAGADVKGELIATAALMVRAGGTALDLNGAVVGQSLLLDAGYQATGMVELTGAKVGGQLNCIGGRFDGDGSDAIRADGVEVGLDVIMRDGFEADGEVLLVEATIGGDLACRGGHFSHPSGRALDARGVLVKADTYLDKGFGAEGEVRFRRATLAGQLSCIQGRFSHEGATAFDGTGMSVGTNLLWREMQAVPEGKVTLADAKVGRLGDDRGSWPREGALDLEGFTYDAFVAEFETAMKLNERLEWLNDTRRFSPQPYQQLSKVYRDMGKRKEGREVAIAKEVDRRRRTDMSFLGKGWHRIKGAVVGYGYAPWRAGVGVVALVVVGTVLFGFAKDRGVMVPTKADRADRATVVRHCTSDYPCFQRLPYAVDAVVPLVNLQQRDNWAPDAHHSWGSWYRAFVWSGTLMGWFLSTMALAGVTGLLDRDR